MLVDANGEELVTLGNGTRVLRCLLETVAVLESQGHDIMVIDVVIDGTVLAFPPLCDDTFTLLATNHRDVAAILGDRRPIDQEIAQQAGQLMREMLADRCAE
jgi:hypothetical protein